MSYDSAISLACADALKQLGGASIIGLGSGRAATVLVQSLPDFIRENNRDIHGVPSSLQIKMVAEGLGIPLYDSDQLDHIDVTFDGADQVDEDGYAIKGGGGAMLRESILFSLAKKVVIIADRSKYVKKLTMPVPVEISPHAKGAVSRAIQKLGGRPTLRVLDKGYPFITENGNIILECDFGSIGNPASLTRRIKLIPGVLESGIFLRKPDVMYKAGNRGRFMVY